eukprot:COSAG01_NODE_53190_length_341_cov_0.578512_1_plen_96_part_00
MSYDVMPIYWFTWVSSAILQVGFTVTHAGAIDSCRGRNMSFVIFPVIKSDDAASKRVNSNHEFWGGGVAVGLNVRVAQRAFANQYPFPGEYTPVV